MIRLNRRRRFKFDFSSIDTPERAYVYGFFLADGHNCVRGGAIKIELRRGFLPVTLDEVQRGVEKFLECAARHREWNFKVVAIGCSLAGFSPLQIGPMFRNRTENVLLPAEFIQVIAGNYEKPKTFAEQFPKFGRDNKRVYTRSLDGEFQVYGEGLLHVAMCKTEEMAERVAYALNQTHP